MTSEVRLFVADVDDTLFSSSFRFPGKITVQALNEMQQRGILTGVASGRPLWQGLYTHWKEWGLEKQFDFLIGMNGGELWTSETDEVQTFFPLEPEMIKEIIEWLQQFENVNPFVYRDEAEVCLMLDDEMLASSKRHGTEIHVVEELSEFWQKSTGKILVRCANEETALKVEKAGREYFAGRQIACFRTNPVLVEIQDARVSKSTGLSAYCSMKKISPEEVIAFGDAENDLEMLRSAGRAVALKNAMPSVKAAADEVTADDAGDDGVGKYLYQTVLKEKAML